ncbi:MAG: hypothetical protein QOH39_2598, partial [Verrucomicrobiota bacterium]
IEHILDDQKLMRDLSNSLKPAGLLLLTTPNLKYRPLTRDDDGPWSPIEDGGHVRRGYSETHLRELCKTAGLAVDEISYCSGFVSQKLTALWRKCSVVNRTAAWALLLPLRILPSIADDFVTRLLRWPYYSICIEAVREGPPHDIKQMKTG